ncbi:putative secreted protein [Clostridium putrefaciens]|uniref:Putative secreted protein n=1 Tax=Clostridium putrefaciens TaxID=99675 RepID=A0A381JBU4_9CLOT|nr:hypothetical protein [Clostridium putrefaciens]SUY47852.1 putative secreted protein [Clostridium putrefaciens]
MGKLSIFSKDYQRRMRKRKFKITIIILVIIIIVGTIFYSGYIPNFIEETKKQYKVNKEKQDIEENQQIEEETKIKEEIKIKEETLKIDEEEDNLPMEELYYEINTTNGSTVKLIYENQNEEKKYKFLDSNGQKVSFDINPSGKNMIIYEEDTQNLFVYDINGEYIDGTLKKFTSASANKIFEKDSVLAKEPSYIWCGTPKFYNDRKIAYVSQLPWFKKEDKYIWILDLNGLSHKKTDISGQNLTISGIKDKGLEIDADGTLNYITIDDNIIK